VETVQNVSFEQAITDLETILQKLEHTTLESSIELYKEGILLADYCSKLVENFKGEIILLQEESGKLHEQQFAADEYF